MSCVLKGSRNFLVNLRWSSKVKKFWKIKYADVTVPFDFSLEGGKSGC